jgi:hypothetical protein
MTHNTNQVIEVDPAMVAEYGPASGIVASVVVASDGPIKSLDVEALSGMGGSEVYMASRPLVEAGIVYFGDGGFYRSTRSSDWYRRWVEQAEKAVAAVEFGGAFDSAAKVIVAASVLDAQGKHVTLARLLDRAGCLWSQAWLVGSMLRDAGLAEYRHNPENVMISDDWRLSLVMPPPSAERARPDTEGDVLTVEFGMFEQ